MAEALEVEEFVFDGSVGGFDIAVGVGGGVRLASGVSLGLVVGCPGGVGVSSASDGPKRPKVNAARPRATIRATAANSQSHEFEPFLMRTVGGRGAPVGARRMAARICAAD